MKIAQVTTFFHPVTGGVETHALELSRSLIENGHDVTVLTSDSNKALPRISEKRTKFLGVSVRRFRTLLRLSPYHVLYPGLFFHLLTSNYDIVHVHGFRKIEVYFALLAKLLKRKKYKLVVTGHNPFPTTSRRIRFNVLVSIHDKTLGRFFTRFIDRMIALVRSEAKKYTEVFKIKPEKVTVVPNGFADEYLEPGDALQFYKDWEIKQDRWESIVVSLGRINKAKGFQYLKTAITKQKKVLFVIAGGDDGYLSKLKFEFSGLKNVLLTERFLSSEKIRDMFAASDLFVFPSLHEAFGIVLLEALASGVPVVSTNQGGTKEFIKKDFGVLIKPEDENLWHDTIKALLEDEKRLKQMGEAGKKFASRYTWTKVTRKIENIYQELIPDADSGT